MYKIGKKIGINDKNIYSTVFIVIVFITLSTFFLKSSSKNNQPIEIINNNQFKEWNNFFVKNTEIFTTSDWFTYEGKNIGEFSIALPNDWKLEGSVFTNNNDQKVAEFSPGLVQLKNNQSCFDVEWSNEDGESEMISLNDIEIGSLKGKLLVEKAPAWEESANKYLYPYFYCLSNGHNAFVMTFYEWNLELTDTELHNKILSTLRF
ncbi:MAG: hypothetical protein WC795_00530 [Candidatus Paceibacterota bacterium]|jgi:hypothetical protein